MELIRLYKEQREGFAPAVINEQFDNYFMMRYELSDKYGNLLVWKKSLINSNNMIPENFKEVDSEEFNELESYYQNLRK